MGSNPFLPYSLQLVRELFPLTKQTIIKDTIMHPTIAIDPADLNALLKYFSRANQFHYDGWCTQEEFDAVQDYIDVIKGMALEYRV